MIRWILLLFILTSCVCASLVNVTQSSYQAEENHNITLEWTFTPTTDGSLNSINIFCEMFTDGKTFILFHLHEGHEVPESQDQRFAGRVQFDKDVLREGRLRLHMSRLRTDDSGLYLCDVLTVHGEGSRKCHLNVTAARDRPKPQRDPSTTESPSEPESPGWIVLSCVVGLIVVVGTLLVVYYYLRGKDSKSFFLPVKQGPMDHSPPVKQGPMDHSPPVKQGPMIRSIDKHDYSLSEVGGPKQRLKVSL